MARMARVVIAGEPHHVTHRGNLRADVFLNRSERELYLGLVGECAAEGELEIWAWCAMTNHVHLLVVPGDRDSLRRGVGLAHQRYAAAVNAQHGWTGHLWANRFFSTPLDAAQLWHAVTRSLARHVRQSTLMYHRCADPPAAAKPVPPKDPEY